MGTQYIEWSVPLRQTRAVALALLASACTDSSSSGAAPEPSGEPSTPTATPDTPDVDFSATISPSADEVVVEWSLTNRSGAPLLVTNRVPDSDGRLPTAADGVLVGRDDGWGFHEHDGTTTVNHGRALDGQPVLCSDPVDVG